MLYLHTFSLTILFESTLLETCSVHGNFLTLISKKHLASGGSPMTISAVNISTNCWLLTVKLTVNFKDLCIAFHLWIIKAWFFLSISFLCTILGDTVNQSCWFYNVKVLNQNWKELFVQYRFVILFS